MLEPLSSVPSSTRSQLATESTRGFAKVSVIMAVRNEAAHLPGCLLALRGQKQPEGGLEIIVALAPSEDGTAEVLDEYVRSGSLNLAVIPNPGLSAAQGLNAALHHARGEIIVRMDGHTVPASDYIVACIDCLERTGASLVGGSMHAVGTTPFGRSVALMLGAPFGAGGAAFHRAPPEGTADTVYLGAWPRSTFTEVGDFDESLPCNQDDEHSRRLLAHDSKIVLSPTIRSTYHCRENARTLLRQYYRYGRWKPRALRRHASAVRPRALAPAALVIGLGAGAVSAVLDPTLALVGFMPWIAYSIAVTFATGTIARREGWSLWPQLIAVTAIMHLAYGAGFLRGLAGKWLLNNPAERDTSSDTERQRIQALYHKRDGSQRYTDSPRVQRALRNSRNAAIAACCEELGDVPFRGRILDIGCGHGTQLAQLLEEGARPNSLAGLELSPERVSIARQGLQGIDIRQGCGSQLPWPDHSFDCILLSMVLSSIQSSKLQQAVAHEAQRCLVPGGLLIIYEMRRLRPFSRGLSAMPLTRLQSLFPAGRQSHRSCTLLPPLLRTLAQLPALCRWLHRFSFLRGHLAMVIKTNPTRTSS